MMEEIRGLEDRFQKPNMRFQYIFFLKKRERKGMKKKKRTDEEDIIIK